MKSVGPLTHLALRQGSPDPLDCVFPCQTPSPAPWLRAPRGPGWFFFYFIFSSARPMKARKVQDPAMGLSPEKLITASLACSWSGPRVTHTSLGKSPPPIAPGKQANLLARLLSAWFLSSPGGCSSPRLTASLRLPAQHALPDHVCG